MNVKVVLVLCLAAAVSCDRRPPSYRPPAPSYNAPPPQPIYRPPQPRYQHSSEESKEKGEPFDFAYEVQDHYKGVEFGHNAESDGNLVTGEYRVLLPDGRTQIVTYTADHYNGYQAEVEYEGEAQYPEPRQYSQPEPRYQPKPRNQYQPPTPSSTYG